jgi:hypothetical protein
MHLLSLVKQSLDLTLGSSVWNREIAGLILTGLYDKLGIFVDKGK